MSVVYSSCLYYSCRVRTMQTRLVVTLNAAVGEKLKGFIMVREKRMLRESVCRKCFFRDVLCNFLQSQPTHTVRVLKDCFTCCFCSWSSGTFCSYRMILPQHWRILCTGFLQPCFISFSSSCSSCKHTEIEVYWAVCIRCEINSL